jgi:predicted AlkP superfamily pyrophosphatase or phosphodiesterase
MKPRALLLTLFIGTFCFLPFRYLLAQDTSQQVNDQRFNQKQQIGKPYVILISADGFRADMAEKFGAKNLLQLSKQGVRARFLEAGFPTVTFPNHYSIITGLHPAHHGLVDNEFYDRKRKLIYKSSNKQQVADSSWYGGKPLWVLAEEQGMLAANFYWVASESAIQGLRATYYYHYNNRISIDKRIQVVANWLGLPEEKRPHFITFYFPEVDDAGHNFGPNSAQTGEAVRWVDEAIGKLDSVAKASGLPVNFVFVSDHGMTDINPKQIMKIPACIDTSRFVIPYGNVTLHLYAKNPVDILPQYERLKKEKQPFEVFLRKKIPKYWKYSTQHDKYDRIGDILLVAKAPGIFKPSHFPISPGKHGFDNRDQDMRATFFAWGPAFVQGIELESFSNVHIYPMIAHLLGLSYQQKEIDGKISVLRPVLKKF